MVSQDPNDCLARCASHEGNALPGSNRLWKRRPLEIEHGSKTPLESCQSAFSAATLPPDLRLSIPDPDGKVSYPIVTFTWILAYAKYENSKTGEALKSVLKYCLTDGQNECAELGYIPLPDQVRQTVLEAVNRIGS